MKNPAPQEWVVGRWPGLPVLWGECRVQEVPPERVEQAQAEHPRDGVVCREWQEPLVGRG